MSSQSAVKLFSPIRFRDLEIRNRIFVSPMCQYSATEGIPNSWHLVHLGSRAVGGAGLVMVEATSIHPKGRISPGDLGLWNEEQMRAFQPITHFLKEHGSVAAIQLAHAGRKASTAIPWLGEGSLSLSQGGWIPMGPSAEAFSDKYSIPQALTPAEIAGVVKDFEVSTKLSLEAGFQVVEIHMAHGYLLQEFLSPLTNHRTDEFGGTLENRLRFPLQVAKAVRALWPQKWPVFVRISSSDWVENGWDLKQSVVLAKKLKELGVDLIDCSSGGAVLSAKIPVEPGYQVPFAENLRSQAGIATGAVGMITSAAQAEKILQEEKADVIFLGREFLRDPYFPMNAAKELGVDLPWPVQYQRAKRG